MPEQTRYDYIASLVTQVDNGEIKYILRACLCRKTVRKPRTRFLYCAVFCCLIRMLSRAARIGSECVGNLGGWMLGAGVEIGTAPLCFFTAGEALH